MISDDEGLKFGSLIEAFLPVLFALFALGPGDAVGSFIGQDQAETCRRLTFKNPNDIWLR
jgi:hypothetical protein